MLFTTLTEVSAEAFTQSSAVVTETTARAIHTFSSAISSEYIRTRGAVDLRAIRASVSAVALAAILLFTVIGVVQIGIVGEALSGKAELSLAGTMSRAVVDAHGCKK